MSTQQRASADCARLAIGDLSSAFAETLQQQRKKDFLWQNKSSRIETLSRDCTCMDTGRQEIQPRTSECVEQQAKADDARRVNLPSSSVSARDFTFSHQTAADTHRKVEGCWKRDKGDCCPRRLDTAC